MLIDNLSSTAHSSLTSSNFGRSLSRALSSTSADPLQAPSLKGVIAENMFFTIVRCATSVTPCFTLCNKSTPAKFKYLYPSHRMNINTGRFYKGVLELSLCSIRGLKHSQTWPHSYWAIFWLLNVVGISRRINICSNTAANVNSGRSVSRRNLLTLWLEGRFWFEKLPGICMQLNVFRWFSNFFFMGILEYWCKLNILGELRYSASLRLRSDLLF